MNEVNLHIIHLYGLGVIAPYHGRVSVYIQVYALDFDN